MAELAAAHGVHRSWLYKLLARYRAEGDAGLVPRSKRPQRSPGRVSEAVEDEIVLLRKRLGEDGLDAGALTIQSHLSQRERPVPSVSTIWRVLGPRGFVVPQPAKRPKSSFVRFEAALPNECWQSDMTHWTLGDGTGVEIVGQPPTRALATFVATSRAHCWADQAVARSSKLSAACRSRLADPAPGSRSDPRVHPSTRSAIGRLGQLPDRAAGDLRAAKPRAPVGFLGWSCARRG